MGRSDLTRILPTAKGNCPLQLWHTFYPSHRWCNLLSSPPPQSLLLWSQPLLYTHCTVLPFFRFFPATPLCTPWFCTRSVTEELCNQQTLSAGQYQRTLPIPYPHTFPKHLPRGSVLFCKSGFGVLRRFGGLGSWGSWMSKYWPVRLLICWLVKWLTWKSHWICGGLLSRLLWRDVSVPLREGLWCLRTFNRSIIVLRF